jgi:hypothetical protein
LSPFPRVFQNLITFCSNIFLFFLVQFHFNLLFSRGARDQTSPPLPPEKRQDIGTFQGRINAGSTLTLAESSRRVFLNFRGVRIAALVAIFEDSTPLSPSLLQLELALSRLSYIKNYIFNSLHKAALAVIFDDSSSLSLLQLELALSRLSYIKNVNFNSLRMAALVVRFYTTLALAAAAGIGTLSSLLKKC